MKKYTLRVWDDSQGWRDGAWRWEVLDEDGATVASADQDYLSRHEADLAGLHAQQRLAGHEAPERTNYGQFFRPDTK